MRETVDQPTRTAARGNDSAWCGRQAEGVAEARRQRHVAKRGDRSTRGDSQAGQESGSSWCHCRATNPSTTRAIGWRGAWEGGGGWG